MPNPDPDILRPRQIRLSKLPTELKIVSETN